MSTGRVLRLISRTINGVEALVNTESGEIFIDVRIWLSFHNISTGYAP